MSLGPCAVCKITADLLCARCHSVFYCGQEHQKNDWPNHRANCSPAYLLALDSDDPQVEFCHPPPARLCLFAARNIKKGEIIINEAPLAVSPYTKSCPGCYKSLLSDKSLVRCPRCSWPVCDEKCPGLSDPDFHGAECQILSRIKVSFSAEKGQIHLQALLPLRCLLLSKNPKEWKIFLQMMNQAEAYSYKVNTGKKSDVTLFLEDAILKPIASEAPHLLPPNFSSSSVKRVMSVVESFCMLFKRPNCGFPYGICPISSYMQHSCLPNTSVTFKDPVNSGGKLLRSGVIIRAAEDIPKGCQLRHCVTDPLIPTIMRQRSLFFNRVQTCICKRCVDPTEMGTNFGTLKCTSCSGWILQRVTERTYDTVFECGNCGKTLDSISYYKEKMQRFLYQIKAKADKIFHPNHSVLFMVNIGLIRCTIKSGIAATCPNESDIHERADLCRRMIKLMLTPCLVQHTNQEISEALLALANLNLEILERKKSSEQLDSSAVERINGHCSELKLLHERFANFDSTEADVENLRKNDTLLSPF